MIQWKNKPYRDPDTGQEGIRSVKYISKYIGDNPLSPAESASAVTMLIHSLGLKQETADLVAEILVEDQWSMRRLRDAVKHVIRTQRYKEIKPSEILSYDKGIEFYSYHEMLDFDTGGSGFFRVQIPGIPNMKRKMDEIEDKQIDAGWWVREGTIIPESWKRG